MGIFDLSMSILISPLLLVVAALNLSPIPRKLPLLVKEPSAAMLKPRRPERGRLILFAVDETSLEAIKWAIANLLSLNDFIHILHILEHDEMQQQKLQPFRFQLADIHKVITYTCECQW